ncbi:hypothetical protein HY085_01710 [Candidatus Gottesmanbacteria bacterium]|nr:hypothetical protein [Candidatus Gottesmanbacteria bacterium]
MKFNNEQLDKISGLFMDLAKGLFLAAFTVPALAPQMAIFSSIRSALLASFLVIASLKVLDLKEVEK